MMDLGRLDMANIVEGRKIDPPERYATREFGDGTQDLFAIIGPGINGDIVWNDGYTIPGGIGYCVMYDRAGNETDRSEPEPIETVFRMSPYGWKYINPLPLDASDTDGGDDDDED